MVLVAGDAFVKISPFQSQEELADLRLGFKSEQLRTPASATKVVRYSPRRI
jgi:hypothetical protein